MTIFDAVRSFLTDETLSPHGICMLWRPELLWTHAGADLLIGGAYFSIPAALAVFLRKRPDVKFSWAVWMFVAFILLCGVTHFMMVWTLWNANYGVEALIKAATAAASVTTAFALWPLLPKVIALPTPKALEQRVAERDQALADLKRAMADMMEMREHERRQKLLLDELNHRVKNTLSSVQAIAMQTITASGDIQAFRETFMSRLVALSGTHNLLVERTWTGASVQDLATRMLAHYGKPLEISGEDAELSPNHAVALGMALHELATNAVKYGAWSADGGSVVVRVDRDPEGRVFLRWEERGGPPVTAPKNRGFGLRLLDGLGLQLSAPVVTEFAPTGLVCAIRIDGRDGGDADG